MPKWYTPSLINWPITYLRDPLAEKIIVTFAVLTTCSSGVAAVANYRLSSSPRHSFMALAMILLLILSLMSLGRGQECGGLATFEEKCGYNTSVYNSTIYRDPPPAVERDRALEAFQNFINRHGNCEQSSKNFFRFGCAAFFPRCEDPRGPCQSLCETVLADCSIQRDVEPVVECGR